jgi:hypothetical protein
MGSRIEIEIDEIVFHDVDVGSRSALRDAIATSLAERCQDFGLPGTWLADGPASSSTAIEVPALHASATLGGTHAIKWADGLADAIHGATPDVRREQR